MGKIRLHFYRGYAAVASGVAAGIVLLGEGVARAATVTEPTNVITSPDQVVQFFCTAMLWMFWGLLVLSLAMFFVGGYTYATAGGDAEKVSKANKTLLYAAIAIVVAISAKGIPLLIGSFLGVDASQLSAC